MQCTKTACLPTIGYLYGRLNGHFEYAHISSMQQQTVTTSSPDGQGDKTCFVLTMLTVFAETHVYRFQTQKLPRITESLNHAVKRFTKI